MASSLEGRAPGPIEELEEQLRTELMRECRWIGERLSEIISIDPESPESDDDPEKEPEYDSHTYDALFTFRDIAFSHPVRPEAIKSVKRVIDVCKKAETTKLLDYAPDVHKVVDRLKRALNSLAEEKKEAEDPEDRKEIAREMIAIKGIVEDLEKMTYAEFLDEGEDIIAVLKRYEYYNTIENLQKYVDATSMLSRTLAEETRKLKEVLNIKDEIE